MAGGGKVHKGGPPKGNKNAVGNIGPAKLWDIEAQAIKLLEWAKTDEATVLNYHAPMEGYSVATMYRWAEENVVFREAMEIAIDLIGARRELLLIKAGNARPFDRMADFYNQKLFEFEEKKRDLESKRKTKENKALFDPEAVKKAVAEYQAGNIKQK